MAAFRLQATFSSFGSRSDSPFSGTSPRCMGFGFILIDGFTEQLALTYFNNGVDGDVSVIRSNLGFILRGYNTYITRCGRRMRLCVFCRWHLMPWMDFFFACIHGFNLKPASSHVNMYLKNIYSPSWLEYGTSKRMLWHGILSATMFVRVWMTSFDLTWLTWKKHSTSRDLPQIDPTQGRNAREQAHWQKAQEPEQENQAMWLLWTSRWGFICSIHPSAMHMLISDVASITAGWQNRVPPWIVWQFMASLLRPWTAWWMLLPCSKSFVTRWMFHQPQGLQSLPRSGGIKTSTKYMKI